MKILLVSIYELGHPPFGLAEPAAWLRARNNEVRSLDLAVEEFDEKFFRWADLIAFYLPMHTATRLAARLIPRARALNARAHLAAYGLYAPMNEGYLRRLGVRTVLGGEFEAGLTALAERLSRGEEWPEGSQPEPRISTAKQRFLVPDRSDLPPLDRYARLLLPDGEERVAGYVEASRGCKHRCRHCPIVPVYEGRFRIVPREIVLADIRQQVAVGARHITFGDPDFLNGPAHAFAIVREMHKEFPDISYDATIKVEHLLAAGESLRVLKDTGCVFVTTAVESFDESVLVRLDKRHTRADVYRVVRLLRALDLALSPTFVPFTPWTTLAGYRDLLSNLAALDLVDAVAPVQLSIRLLIPPGSRLLDLDDIHAYLAPLDEEALSYPWSNPDPRVDALQAEVQALVQGDEGRARGEIFARIRDLAHTCAGLAAPSLPPPSQGRFTPRLSEPWYCCAEPTDEQLASV